MSDKVRGPSTQGELSGNATLRWKDYPALVSQKGVLDEVQAPVISPLVSKLFDDAYVVGILEYC